jgi:hypothetical protein
MELSPSRGRGRKLQASTDGKGTQLLHGRLALFNSANLSARWAAMKQPCETIQLFAVADSVNLYPSVVLVLHPSANTY